MTYDQFIKSHKNKACNIDGVAGAQCVDLAVAYMDEEELDVVSSAVK